MNENINPVNVGAKDAARIIGVSLSGFYYLLKKEDTNIRKGKIGGRVVYPYEDVVAYAERAYG